MTYNLDTWAFAQNPVIAIVGCGGTGAFVAEGLCRLFTGRNAQIQLIDHDRIEPHNLLRQAFYPNEIGKFKSQALAERLTRAYGKPIAYCTTSYKTTHSYSHTWISPSQPDPKLIIGCVDNAQARKHMNEAMNPNGNRWNIDAGNGYTWGQILIGNTSHEDNLSGSFQGNTCTKLPSPVLQRPDLLTAIPHTPPDMDCAAALDLTDQDPTINHMMASWVIQVVLRMAVNRCPFMAIDIDLDLGTTVSTYATPENVARTLNIQAEALIVQEQDQPQPPAA